MTLERQELLNVLDRLEAQIRMARGILNDDHLLMPCKEVHPGLWYGASRFRIGDFIIEDTVFPKIENFSCTGTEFATACRSMFPDPPEIKALFVEDPKST